MVWNLPNSLTALRIALIPFFVGFAYVPGRWGLILSTALFGMAALTDWFDGYFARQHGMATNFGRFFDPIADKLLVISALVLLVGMQRAPLLLVMVTLAREVLVMALRERMAGLGRHILVSSEAKWKTGFQMAAILMLLVQDGLMDVPLQQIGLFFLYISTIFSLLSGFRYFRDAWPVIQKNN
ncbi:MAG: CDP-diacylglycerol--glycerol-3-phosphate 3-phosphatidyltransferase [Nitrospirae bacterium]|nr:CDP-diacylglycerol--glycerol-3-phosphate 3-phosphatidyltransferase [Magnetococcales bacterium]HAT49434.1 CDP-diacylglycerol--glycerol-3-phosphate 3-phosphatidyltransferase [Alphaproteobacteria bacterium]